jgi:hypothetical protein
MTPSLGAYAVILIGWLATAQSSDELKGDREAGDIRLAQERIICPNRGDRSCRTVMPKSKGGCRRVSTGGIGKGNSTAVACDRG